MSTTPAENENAAPSRKRATAAPASTVTEAGQEAAAAATKEAPLDAAGRHVNMLVNDLHAARRAHNGGHSGLLRAAIALQQEILDAQMAADG